MITTRCQRRHSLLRVARLPAEQRGGHLRSVSGARARKRRARCWPPWTRTKKVRTRIPVIVVVVAHSAAGAPRRNAFPGAPPPEAASERARRACTVVAAHATGARRRAPLVVTLAALVGFAQRVVAADGRQPHAVGRRHAGGDVAHLGRVAVRAGRAQYRQRRVWRLKGFDRVLAATAASAWPWRQRAPEQQPRQQEACAADDVHQPARERLRRSGARIRWRRAREGRGGGVARRAAATGDSPCGRAGCKRLVSGLRAAARPRGWAQRVLC